MYHLHRIPTLKYLMSLNFLILVGALAAFVGVTGSQSLAQEAAPYAEVRQVLEADQLQVTQPSGLAYIPAQDAFIVVEATNVPGTQGSLTLYDPATNESRLLTGDLVVEQPASVTYDNSRQQLLVLNGVSRELMVATLDVEQATVSVVTSYALGAYNLLQPAGLAVDGQSGTMYIVDSAAAKVVGITPDSNGNFASNEATVAEIDLAFVSGTARGIAHNPANGHLYVLELGAAENAATFVHELTVDGQHLKTHDVSAGEVVSPQAMVFALSGDQTDAPDTYDLYIADRGQAEEVTTVDPSLLPNQLYLPMLTQDTNSSGPEGEPLIGQVVPAGKVVEIALDQPLLEVHAAATTATLNLVRTIDSSVWSPPSPDPSGITYNPSAGEWVISDGEVDEISRLFQTKQNVYRMNLSGGLNGTMSTMAFSREPTGASYDPVGRRIFYSDDDKRKIFEVRRGNDDTLGTADDIVTSISVTPFTPAGRDPEDVYVDTTKSVPEMWIIDGLNAEVYHVLPGPNGLFDGVPTTGDDVVKNFDTRALGIIDPEGIYLNAATGNLILTSRDKAKMFEVAVTNDNGTLRGSLVRILDMAAAKAVKPAGVTMAPSSTTAGVLNYYLVDRGLDNNDVPDENDGRIYELSEGSQPGGTPTPTRTPTRTPTPVASPTPTSTPVPGSTLSFGASDDSYVRSDWPNSNYGTQTTVRVLGSPQQINSYFKFTVSGLAGAPRSAKLRLYVVDSSPIGGALYLVSNNYLNTNTPWLESGIKFNNAPPIAGSPLTSLGSVGTNVWVEFDVTAAITGNGQYSFAITSTSSNSVLYNARNASVNTPMLVIQP